MQGLGQQQVPIFNNPSQIYKIVSILSPHFCLDCTFDSETSGKLVLYTQNDGLHQKWRVMSDFEGNVGFMSLQNMGVLQMPSQAKKGAQCLVSAPSGSINEKWRITPAGKGFVIRSAAHPELCLDICEEKAANNTKIIAWEAGSNKPNQEWVFVPL